MQGEPEEFDSGSSKAFCKGLRKGDGVGFRVEDAIFLGL